MAVQRALIIEQQQEKIKQKRSEVSKMGKAVKTMSEEQKEQAARIIREVNTMETEKREVVLAYMQGFAAGAQMMQQETQKQSA